jgi:hypothetical protein
MARALRLQAEFIARPSRREPLAEAAACASAACKTLRPALRAARSDGPDFIPNLKFCRIYEGLEKTVAAVDGYTELLARTL